MDKERNDRVKSVGYTYVDKECGKEERKNAKSSYIFSESETKRQEE